MVDEGYKWMCQSGHFSHFILTLVLTSRASFNRAGPGSQDLTRLNFGPLLLFQSLILVESLTRGEIAGICQ